LNHKLAFALLSSLIVLVLGETRLAQELHPKLRSGEKIIRTILVLPPKVEIVRQSVKGTESMIKESEELEEVVLRLVSKILNEKKINLSPSPFTPQALEANNELKYALADIQSRYDQLLPKMRKNSKDVAKARFSLGDEVVKLNPDGSADALLFIRANGVQPTPGRLILGTLSLRPTFPIVPVSIGIVDSHTGEVLFFAKPLAIGDLAQKGEKGEKGEKVLYKPIAKSLKKLPNAP
jgi:hypothetical protein